MDVPKVFESEYRLCLILWENEPIRSSELVQLCRERLGWKPTTTYTVIKRLSERGVLKNENSVVTSLVSKDQVQAAEIDELGVCGSFHQAPQALGQGSGRGAGDDRPVPGGGRAQWLNGWRMCSLSL